jgi:cytochrome oxidase Cu insertion factor (SCO1/SenC/PrrC family)
MRSVRILTSILSIFFFVAFAQAQLGPKDGEGLSPTDLDRVNVGERAPDFTLENMDGRPITLSDFRGQELVVLVFYRGHW